jgi:predicted ATPase
LADFQEVLNREWERVQVSRKARGDDRQSSKPSALVGLALSSGSLRAEFFGLGVVRGLAQTGLLKAVDYVSSVEAGASAAGWLSAEFARADFETVLSKIAGKAPDWPRRPPSVLHVWLRNIGLHLIGGLLILFALAAGRLAWNGAPVSFVWMVIPLALGIVAIWFAHGKNRTDFASLRTQMASRLNGDVDLDKIGHVGPYPIFGANYGMALTPLFWGYNQSYYQRTTPLTTAEVVVISGLPPKRPDILDRVLNLSDSHPIYGFRGGAQSDKTAIYELVRRQCSFIIACDATDDPNISFEALGDVIRKCRADLGVAIDIPLLSVIPTNGVASKHYELGTIRYSNGETGLLLYLKPSITPDETTDLNQYSRSHPEFPNTIGKAREISEAAAESYLLLGMRTVTSLVDEASPGGNWKSVPVPQILSSIRRKLRPDLVLDRESRVPIEIPPDLVDVIASRDCILCGGIGLAAQAGLPGWAALFEGILRLARERQIFDASAAKELASSISNGQLDEAGDELIHKVPPVLMEEFLAKLLPENTPPSSAHRVLGEMPFAGVLNTSLDAVLAKAFREPMLLPTGSNALVSALQQKTSFVANLNGSIQAPVLSARQFRSALAANRQLKQFLETLFFKYHALFVGSSLDGVKGFLDALDLTRQPDVVHYILVADEGQMDPVKVRFLERTYNVKLVAYQSGFNYAGLPEYLSQLSAAVRKRVSTQQRDAPSKALRAVKLRNIGPFDSLDLDLTAGWNVILGDNGKGKTVILRAIAAALSGEQADSIAVARLLKSGADSGTIRLTVDNRDYTVELSRDRDRKVQIIAPKLSPVLEDRWLAIGVPSLRSVPWENPAGPKETETKDPNSEDLSPLLRGAPDGRVANLKQWIVNLDYSGRNEVVSQFFEVLQKLTPGLRIELEEVNRDTKEIWVRTDGGVVPLAAVSQGTGSVMSWIGTLLERMDEAGISRSDRTLLLIDEIDAHMHPRWQQAFTAAFSDLFPSAQIIATTHSPLIIGSLKKEEIWLVRKSPLKSEIDGVARVRAPRESYVEIAITGPEPDPEDEPGKPAEVRTYRVRDNVKLRIRDGEVVQAGEAISEDETEIGAERLDIPPEGWRVDQILTLPYFGLETTRDAKTTELIQEFTDLSAMPNPPKERVEELAAKLNLRAPAPHESEAAREAFQLINAFAEERLKSLDAGQREKILREVKVQLTESITGSRRPV